jgi:hypothetical protein
LNLPVYCDPILSKEVEMLARKIVGTTANGEIQGFARLVADAHIDLRRVRQARHKLLSDALSDPCYESEATFLKKLALVRHHAHVAGPFTPMPDDVAEFLHSKPEGPCKLASIVLEKGRQLRALDRYERRARSRRKFAIRALDAARAELS